jgi:hypothetical protein
VFAVVQDQQRPLPGEERRDPGLLAQAQRLADRDRHEVGVAQLGQFDEPHTVRERAPHLGADPQRQPGLADPARAGQGDQAAGGQESSDVGHLLPPTDETGHFGRQVAGGAARGRGGAHTSTVVPVPRHRAGRRSRP